MRTAFLVLLIGCADLQAGAPICPPGEAPACLGLGEEALPEADETIRSVEGGALTVCSTEPMTGFFRDGSCRTGPSDRGVHVVCGAMTEDFLRFTRAQGNDLSTPAPRYGFPGLKAGDRWCLCAARWEEARRAGHAPPVVLDATHAAALRSTSLDSLRAHAQP